MKKANNYLYGFLQKNWFAIVVTTIFILFFGKIAFNNSEYKKYIERFDVECNKKGGVMFIPTGVKGWPDPECRNPSSIIDIDVSSLMEEKL